MSKGSGPVADLSALSDLAPELAEMLVSVACDIALVLDEGGVIQSIAQGGAEPVAGTSGEWVGQRWTDTITGETRHKAEEFLHDLAKAGVSRLRHLSHASAAGSEIPVAYTGVRLGDRGLTLAVGRDLRAVEAMQQRLIQSQQDIERDYWQRRQTETRYRLLFQVAAEPLLILDATTFEVLDASRAAAVLVGLPVEQLTGQPVTVGIDPSARDAFGELLDQARESARLAEGETQLAHGKGRVSVSATPFQTDQAIVLLLLLRPRPQDLPAMLATDAGTDAIFAELVKYTQDAIVICDTQGRVSLTNSAFRELVELPPTQTIAGRELGDWIENRDGGVEKILAGVRREGFVRLLSAGLRRGNGRAIDIELSATRLPVSDAVGFIIRVAHHQESSGLIGKDSVDRDVH